MSVGVKRSVVVAVASLLWLSGCETTSLKAPDLFGTKTDTPADTTGSIGGPPPIGPHDVGDKGPPAEELTPAMPSTPNDDLSLGRMNFRQGNYGLAERYFRRAVEAGPRDADAWLGLAASYDRLRRFDLADRAYKQLYGMMGRTPELLNNQGYSYMLRGDYAHARATLLEARAKDPRNPYIANNLALLAESIRTHRAVR
ncbi:MAG TPA: tetratricopeptide repeat protein [Xanthobacteraceae bacterium]|nr:tetratricopeptide repeat protein [Xanthobacteraceae bacterium]